MVGHELAFIFAKHHAKEIMSANIASLQKSAIIEKIAPQKISTWEDEGKEFVINGKMYDVVGYDKKEQVYLCINDSKESDIVQYYNQWMQSNQGSKEQKKGVLAALKWYTIECPIEIINKEAIPTSNYIPIAFISKYYNSEITSIVEAPPEWYL
jgi:hypothetical protein